MRLYWLDATPEQLVHLMFCRTEGGGQEEVEEEEEGDGRRRDEEVCMTGAEK